MIFTILRVYQGTSDRDEQDTDLMHLSEFKREKGLNAWSYYAVDDHGYIGSESLELSQALRLSMTTHMKCFRYDLPVFKRHEVMNLYQVSSS